MNKLLLPAMIAVLLVGCGEKKDPEPMNPKTSTEHAMPKPAEPSNMDREPNRQSGMSQNASGGMGTAGTPNSSATTGSVATNGGETEAEKRDLRTSEEVNRDSTGAAETGSRTTSPAESNH